MRPIAVKNRDMGSESRFLPIPPAFDAPVKGGGFPSEYCYAVWHRKTRIMWLPDCEKFLICSFVLTEFTKITYTHTHTDTAWWHMPRLCTELCGKNTLSISIWVVNMQGDHSPDNVKFPDDSQHSSAALLCGTLHVKCYSYHARQWWG